MTHRCQSLCSPPGAERPRAALAAIRLTHKKEAWTPGHRHDDGLGHTSLSVAHTKRSLARLRVRALCLAWVSGDPMYAAAAHGAQTAAQLVPPDVRRVDKAVHPARVN